MKRVSLLQNGIHACSTRSRINSTVQTRTSHAKVLKEGVLVSNIYVANSLADAYCKCGSMHEALRLFGEILNPNAVSWNLMISGYHFSRQFDESMAFFCLMRCRGYDPDMITYGSVLSACAESENVCFGRQIYALVLKNGFLSNAFVCTGLISLFSRSFDFGDAISIFSEVSIENAVCYNAIIAGCIKNNKDRMALDFFSRMVHQFLAPSEFTFSSVLAACTALGELESGRQMHAWVIKYGYADDLYVGTNVVDLYAKCGDIDDAVMVFSQMPIQNVVTWTAIISGFVQMEDYVNCFRIFREMRLVGEEINAYTMTSVLTACSQTNIVTDTSQIHCLVVKFGFYLYLVVRDALINAYSKIGEFHLAKGVFDEMGFLNDAQSWAVMISGFAQNQQFKQAIELYWRMLSNGQLPDAFCSSSMLSIVTDVFVGLQLHSYVVKVGLLDRLTVSSSLLTMYSKSNCISEAYKVFTETPEKDAILWTSMIAGFSEHGFVEDAFLLFRRLVFEENLAFDRRTLVAVLYTCSTCQSLKRGKEVHGHIIRIGLIKDIGIGGALVNMYSKCRLLDSAIQIFYLMPQKDQVAWTSLLSGFSQNGHFKGAFDLYNLMAASGVKIDCFTASSIIGVLGNLNKIDMGKQLHAYCIKTCLDMDPSVSSSLVSMYSQSGHIEDSLRLFDEIKQPDLVTWTSMIVGYAQHGQGLEALKMYELMKKEGINPDSATFIGLLSACCHNGLVDEGCCLFDSMITDYGLAPELQHFACLVDLLCKAGKLNEAKELIDSMAMKPDAYIWGTLLAACRLHGNVDLGKLAASNVLEQDPNDDGAYVSLSNIYADLDEWEEVDKIRKLMKGYGVRKEVGISFT